MTSKEQNSQTMELIGINISIPQEQAIAAIQKLLEKTNYKEKLNNKILRDMIKYHRSKGPRPYMEFTILQYLEAYFRMNNPAITGEFSFSTAEKSEALKALMELHNKKFLITHEQNGQDQTKRVETVDAPINIISGLELIDSMRKAKTDEALNLSDARTIKLRPSKLLINLIDKYFKFKPAQYRDEIKIILGKSTPKYIYSFIDLLLLEIAYRKGLKRINNIEELSIKRNWQTLAQNIGMDHYIKKGQHELAQGMISKCLSGAKKLGYLSEYYPIYIEEYSTLDERGHFYLLTLNPKKYIPDEEMGKNNRSEKNFIK
jgi:hypothetical protein